MYVKHNSIALMRLERKKRGITEVEMSRRMGLNSAQHYWNIENGKNRLTLEYAALAAKALNVDPSFFICEIVKRKV
ncbi:helix-turn-helix domain-containing protein [Fructilactobacillus cliffordii]|uniref:Helix-turn-helix domain-containing protein n=1 Tax=Fructilactobacillus cliffordii TaxID=2940299 RepID=A0A9Q8ZUS2_9LACO|nr:helix-turn-helix transcriptional regulator [Fructilactobacillus cliffordii]USS89984.1 helix-turn-helix domain-containing protein [Fructilactobacillus cliffordii]